MKRVKTLFAAATLLLAFTVVVRAEDPSAQIIGVWKLISNSNKEVATGKINYPLGQNPVGHTVFTKGGHIIFSHTASDRAKPAGASATDAERVALYNTLVAGGGIYKVDGNTLTVTYDTSWLQTWTGTTQKRKIAFSGNRLTVTSEPTKLSDGRDIVFEVVYERVE